MARRAGRGTWCRIIPWIRRQRGKKSSQILLNDEECARLQLRFVRSALHLVTYLALHLVTYLDVGKFCDKSTETTLHEIYVQLFLRFSYSSKPSQSVSLIDSSKPSQFVLLIYELA